MLFTKNSDQHALILTINRRQNQKSFCYQPHDWELSIRLLLKTRLHHCDKFCHKAYLSMYQSMLLTRSYYLRWDISIDRFYLHVTYSFYVDLISKFDVQNNFPRKQIKFIKFYDLHILTYPNLLLHTYNL